MITNERPDDELEPLARTALAAAAASFVPSPSLDERVRGLARSHRPRRGSRGLLVAGAAAALVIVAVVVVWGRGDGHQVVTTKPSTSGTHWWSGVSGEWTSLPAPPVPIWYQALASETAIVGWEAAGSVDQRHGTGNELRLGDDGVWARHAASVPPWSDGITVATDSGPLLVAITDVSTETAPVEPQRLVSVESKDGNPTVHDLGPIGGTLPTRLHVLPAPGGVPGPVWAFSTDGDDHLHIEATDGERRRSMGSIDIAGVRELAVGTTPAHEPLLLTQQMDTAHGASLLVAWAYIDGSWTQHGTSTFPEATATWTGDRFVVVERHPESEHPVALQFTTGETAADTSWKAIGAPNVAPCEGPRTMLADGSGGAIGPRVGGRPTSDRVRGPGRPCHRATVAPTPSPPGTVASSRPRRLTPVPRPVT